VTSLFTLIARAFIEHGGGDLITISLTRRALDQTSGTGTLLLSKGCKVLNPRVRRSFSATFLALRQLVAVIVSSNTVWCVITSSSAMFA
jgi:hypothetical protein